MNNIEFQNVRLSGGFWKQKQDLIENTTVKAVYDRFKETGRIDAFACNWKPDMPKQPHCFWDSDCAKWIESVAYITRNNRNAELEALADEIIDNIEKNRMDDGYFNIYFTVVEKGKRFTDRSKHELYSAGHLIEAAVAYYNATGKDKLLRCMEDYTDLIYKIFIEDKSADFITPGHEEIELALFRLYELTKNPKHLELAKFFIDKRGCENDQDNADSNQSHLPVRAQTDAVGHAVRAVYLYSGMADYARICNDKEMREACDRLFFDLTQKKMYVTGGIGSLSVGERLTVPYDLPNAHAYAETCAAIGLIFFCSRMRKMKNDPVYADIIERILYNGFLSALSLDGKAFFYENPLSIPDKSLKFHETRYPATQRKQVFSCSCCPPNITRLIPSVSGYIYTTDNKTVYVEQYMASVAEFDGCRIEQITDYPFDGKITVNYHGENRTLKFRVPFWCSAYGDKVDENGYYSVDVNDGDTVKLDFPMEVRLYEADPRVANDCGKVAVMYGPTVFCLESVDNGDFLSGIRIPEYAQFDIIKKDGTVRLECNAYRKPIQSDLYAPVADKYTPHRAVFIPYREFANRGESGMTVWVNADGSIRI